MILDWTEKKAGSYNEKCQATLTMLADKIISEFIACYVSIQILFFLSWFQ